MKRVIPILLSIYLLAALSRISVAQEDDDATTTIYDEDYDEDDVFGSPYDEGPMYGPQCGVYYAESTIPGAGYGIFAGRDFRESEWVLPGDLVVPIVEMGWHNGHQSYHHLWEEYQWSGRR